MARTVGNSIDDLVRHHFAKLQPMVIEAMVDTLKELGDISQNPNIEVVKASVFNISSKSKGSSSTSSRLSPAPQLDNNNSMVEDDTKIDENVENSKICENSKVSENFTQNSEHPTQNDISKKEQVPLMEYYINFLQFIEAILSHNQSADNSKLFIQKGGLKQVMRLLQPKSLPDDFPSSLGVHQIGALLKTMISLTKDDTIFGSLLNEFYRFVTKPEIVIGKSKLEYSKFYDLNVEERPSFLVEMAKVIRVDVEVTNKNDSSESGRTGIKNTPKPLQNSLKSLQNVENLTDTFTSIEKQYQDNLLVLQSMLQVVNSLLEVNKDHVGNGVQVTATSLPMKNRTQFLDHIVKSQTVHLIRHNLSNIQRNLSWETSMVYFNFLDEANLEALSPLRAEISETDKIGENEAQNGVKNLENQSMETDDKPEIEKSSILHEKDTEMTQHDPKTGNSTNSNPSPTNVPSQTKNAQQTPNSTISSRLPLKIKTSFTTAYQVIKTISELKSNITCLLIGNLMPSNRINRNYRNHPGLPSQIMPVITDKYQWIAANIIQSSIDSLSFEEIVPIEEHSMPKSLASHSLMLGLDRMKLMHFNNNVVSLVKILTDIKCNVYHYQLVTFHARGGFNLLHLTFKHAMTILFASDASVNDKNEKNCQLVDIFNKINDFEETTDEISSNLKKIEINFKKCNRQAALNYIDLYLSLLDKLTDCQEVLNSKYPLPDKHYTQCRKAMKNAENPRGVKACPPQNPKNGKSFEILRVFQIFSDFFRSFGCPPPKHVFRHFISFFHTVPRQFHSRRRNIRSRRRN